ncbi:MAG TPA: sigma-70 family RNA polymerase sigma factor, partial [Candidatus Xenobia bacterium]
RAADEDLALIERFKQGDQAAFDSLMRKYQATVHNLIFRFTGDASAVDDLAQEVFLRLYRSVHRFEAQSKFFTYLYRVTLNVCLKERDRSKKRRAVSLDAPRDDQDDKPAREIPDPAGSAEDAFSQRETARIIKAAVMSLPEEQRVAVVLHKYENMAYEEIAATLQLSLPAVKSRLHRAKLALKELLQAHIKT